jgi:catechol 2,3-dioxygenase-like lactoylglutathione lyase family enzyme
MNAVTLMTQDMDRAVRFYLSLGFNLKFGGIGRSFTSFGIGDDQALNLISSISDRPVQGWGRIIFHVTDVDRYLDYVQEQGHRPEGPPRNPDWGERYFHLKDPDGHELSFARPLESGA